MGGCDWLPTDHIDDTDDIEYKVSNSLGFGGYYVPVVLIIIIIIILKYKSMSSVSSVSIEVLVV